MINFHVYFFSTYFFMYNYFTYFDRWKNGTISFGIRRPKKLFFQGIESMHSIERREESPNWNIIAHGSINIPKKYAEKTCYTGKKTQTKKNRDTENVFLRYV